MTAIRKVVYYSWRPALFVIIATPVMMYEIYMWAGWIGFALWGMRINAGPHS